MIWIPSSADEQGVFKRFLETQRNLTRQHWLYAGANHERPDFVLSEEKIGVELAEWIHPKQMKVARETERFEAEINQAAEHSGLIEFTKSFELSPNTRFKIVLSVRTIIPRRSKERVIRGLLDYLRAAKKPETDRERKFGVGFSSGELPKNLTPYFCSVRIIEAPSRNFNFGITVNRSASFNPYDAVLALLDQIQSKVLTKRELYSNTKAEKKLQHLWLLLHYGRAMHYNTPYDGLGLKEGRPLDERTNRQIIVERAGEFIGEIGAGPFDRVFLLFDMTPGFECMELFSRGGVGEVPNPPSERSQ
jgi:hypothetical protein